MILLLIECPGDRPYEDPLDNPRYSFIKKCLGKGYLKDTSGQPISRAVFDVCYISDEPIYRNDKLDQRAFKVAYRELLPILKERAPAYKCIVPLGAAATKAITGLEKLNEALGKVVYSPDVPDVPIVANYIPKQVQVNYEELGIRFLKALDMAVSFELGVAVEEFEADKLTPFEIINTIARFKEVIEDCVTVGYFAFDYETTGFEYYLDNHKITILSFSYQMGYSFVIPIDHINSPFSTEEVREIFTILQDRIFANRKVEKIAHNLKYEAHWSTRYGITKYVGIFHDTMLMAHLVDETEFVGLKEITKRLFPEYGDYGGEKWDWATVGMDKLASYGAIDVDITIRIKTYFEQLLVEDGRLYNLYRNLVMPAFWAIHHCEHKGAKIDTDLILSSRETAIELLDEKEGQLLSDKTVMRFTRWKTAMKNQEEIEELREKQGKHKPGSHHYNQYEAKINNIRTGKVSTFSGINFSSPDQLKELLYSKEGFNFDLPWDMIEEDYTESTSREALQDINHPFITSLMEYRSIKKMVTTYYDGILERVDHRGYLHGTLKQTGTVTGRLSSQNPNLQNMPSRSHVDDPLTTRVIKMVKKFFVGRTSDDVLMQYDYSQAELRTVANVSGDPTMRQAYLDGVDLHALTGAKLRGVSLEEFMQLDPAEIKKWRKYAKGSNFGLIYDVSVPGYIRYFKQVTKVLLTEKEGSNHQSVFFKTYSTLKQWHDRYRSKAKKYGYVRTLFGRKRNLKNVHNVYNPKRASADLRAAINSPIQGTSAEYTLFAFALLRWRLPQSSQMFGTIHDSILYYHKSRTLRHCLEIVKDTCENPPVDRFFGITKEKYPITMKIDTEGSFQSWGDMAEDFVEKELDNIPE